jgi:adenylate cyclase
VRMAVEMRGRFADLAAKWRKLGFELGFSVGIAHGFATLGRIGFEGRFDYAAVGSVVNLAARLCGEAEAGQILVDRRVYAAVEALVEAEPTGELTLKGFHRPVPAFNIRALRN